MSLFGTKRCQTPNFRLHKPGAAPLKGRSTRTSVQLTTYCIEVTEQPVCFWARESIHCFRFVTKCGHRLWNDLYHNCATDYSHEHPLRSPVDRWEPVRENVVQQTGHRCVVHWPGSRLDVATYEAPSMSVKRACDWSVTAPRRAVRVSEARMGVVNGRDVLPSRSRNSCPALQWRQWL